MTKLQSVGGVAESLPNTSQSPTRLNVQDVKPSINTLKNSLAELIREPTGEFNCVVAKLLKELPPEESELLKVALDNEKIRHRDLVNVLKDEGFRVAESSMSVHRRKMCRCFK